MIEVSRRNFLGGAISFAAIAIVAPSIKTLPVLWGDGIHDDTGAFQALVDGKPVHIASDAITVRATDTIYLRGGSYKINLPIKISGKSLHIENVHLIGDVGAWGDGDTSEIMRIGPFVQSKPTTFRAREK